MKTLTRLLAAALLGVASMANAQINMPNPNEPGSSMMTAVRIVAANDIMVDRSIKRWLRIHYPDWDAEQHEFQNMGDERYAVVYIRSQAHPSRRVYFRVYSSMTDQNQDGTGFPF